MPVPFQLPRLYPILDTTLLAARNCPVKTAAEGLFEARVRILQYRHKDTWTQPHFDEAKRLAERCQDLGVLFVLNDRADFARLLRTALHVGQDDIPPIAARGIISDEVMGFSTHNLPQLRCANEEPVEYLSIGPIFPTNSKLQADPVIGLDGIGELRDATSKPLVAIGGINIENAKETLATKVDSLAVVSGLLPDRCDKKSIRRRAEEWLTLLA
jgi:thiamine-phosphate pyrophosphorylase